MKFINLKGIDPFLDDPSAANDIWIKPELICHVEHYSGMWPLQAFGPDNKVVFTGKHKQILGGSLVIFFNGSQRCVLNSTKDIIETLESNFS